MACHPCASILVHNQFASGNIVAANRLTEELLGKRCVLSASHHPSNDEATEEVEDNVQIQEHNPFDGW